MNTLVGAVPHGLPSRKRTAAPAAVTVRTTRTGAGSYIKATHAEANHIDIANGHLLVLK